MHQIKRMSVYEEFCEKQTAVLFATDIAARGLDFPNIDWVLQMDCPDDASSYIHRAGRTARYQKGGESLLMLLPSEEAMVEQLAQKKIPIQKIEVNPSKLVSIQRKLEAMLARDVELKQMAQRAFVTYAKSVFLMKDKSIFDVTSIDLNALARSLGLAVAPRVRFLQKHLKATEPQTASPQAPRMLKPNYDIPADKPIAAQSTEQKWRRNDLEAAYDFHAEDDVQDSDSDDGIFKIKRKNHALPGFEEPEDEEEEEVVVGKKKKEKIITKEKVAKRILAKKLKANKIVNFDDEGNVILFSCEMIQFHDYCTIYCYLLCREFMMHLARKFPSSAELLKLKLRHRLLVASIWMKPKRRWKRRINTTKSFSVNASKLNIAKIDSKPKQSVGSPTE